MTPSAELVANFDTLPDNSVVPTKVAAAVLNISECTLRRQKALQQVRLSARRVGYRVADIREHAKPKAA
jgi:hypothetical protein